MALKEHSASKFRRDSLSRLAWVETPVSTHFFGKASQPSPGDQFHLRSAHPDFIV